MIATADQANIQSYDYVMCGHAKQCVERYCELGGVDIDILKRVATPCMDDHQLAPEDFQAKGRLSDECSKIVLKALFRAEWVGRIVYGR